jgi:phage baseplate assembly protein W
VAQIQKISQSFKDISLSLDVHPITKDLLTIKDSDAIKKSIRNLIQTIPGEKFFNSSFGSELRVSLFDFIDFGTASVLQQQIEIAVSNYEPRVENVSVEVNPKPNDNAFEISVYFDIIGQEFPSQKFNYILEATR